MNFQSPTIILLYAVTFAVAAYLCCRRLGVLRTDSCRACTSRKARSVEAQWINWARSGHCRQCADDDSAFVFVAQALAPNAKLGDIRYWLNYHIWMGITGPILVLFHTTFKFGEIVSVSFWSMAAVALSGFLGRYIYVQIPRSMTGNELSSTELEELEEELQVQLAAETEGNDKVLMVLREYQDQQDFEIEHRHGFFAWLSDSLFERFRFGRIEIQIEGNGRYQFRQYSPRRANRPQASKTSPSNLYSEYGAQITASLAHLSQALCNYHDHHHDRARRRDRRIRLSLDILSRTCHRKPLSILQPAYWSCLSRRFTLSV